MLRYEKYLFHATVLIALIVVLYPQYYITGDGPSHTYNAKVLFDYVLNRERDFYKEFYQINRAIDPNWMSHLGIGVLLQFFPPWLADKLFQVVYILVFAYGFRFLIGAIDRESSYLSFLFYPFVFTLPFQQGFYNYCIALGFMFWTLGFYLKTRAQFENSLYQLVCSVLLLITAFSHGMPAVYTMCIIILLWLSRHYVYFIPFDSRRVISELARLKLVFLPAAFMILLFMAKRGSGTEAHAWSYGKKLVMFLQAWSSQSTRSAEIFPAVSAYVLIVLFGFYLLIRGRKLKSDAARSAWVFLFFSVFTFVSYMTCPHSIGGAGSIDIRLGFLPPLFLLLFFASYHTTASSKLVFIALSVCITIAFQAIRLPWVMKANAVGKEIMSVSTMIEGKSVVLNIHLDDWQTLTSKDKLFHHDGSFIHFSDYLGAEKNKHLIMVMNYEAEINYFPVNWAPGMNPRESIEGMIPGEYPPCGKILAYEQQIGRKVDYVLLQNYKEYPLCSKDLQTQLDTLTSKLYESPNHYVKLYKRR